MRISDWSSDVCSSDLGISRKRQRAGRCAGDHEKFRHLPALSWGSFSCSMKFRARECPDIILRRPWRRWDDAFRRPKGELVMPALVLDAGGAALGCRVAVPLILPLRTARKAGVSGTRWSGRVS